MTNIYKNKMIFIYLKNFMMIHYRVNQKIKIYLHYFLFIHLLQNSIFILKKKNFLKTIVL